PNLGNNVSSTSTTVQALADLSVAKTGPATVTAGTNATYTITVSNGGPSDAQTVALSDAVPANTTFVSFAAPPGWTPGSPPVGGPGTVPAITPPRAAGSAAQVFTLVVQVSTQAPDGASLSNTATVSTATNDTNTANNTATTTTTVNNPPAISISDFSGK